MMFITMPVMLAHGVITEVNIQSPSIIIKSSYSQSEPAIGAVVTVYGHGNEESPYQTGKTDNSGFFAFVPDITGEWIFIVDDQQGHMKKVTITVNESFFTSHNDQATAEEDLPLLTKVLIGLTWILGLTSLFYGIRTYQVGRNKKSEG